MILEVAQITFEECFLVDGPRLQQVLNNLLGNAIKFTERGDITVTVSVTDSAFRSAERNHHHHQQQQQQQQQQQSFLLFEVTDSGIGIPETVLSQLFTNFYQVSQPMHKGGTGLGLAICKQLIRMMGGQIGVHSEHDKGSTFWFTIPSQRPTPTALKDFERRHPVREDSLSSDEDLTQLMAKVAWVCYPNEKVVRAVQGHLEGAGVRISTYPSLQHMMDSLAAGAAPNFLVARYLDFQQNQASIPKDVKRVALVPWSKQITFDPEVADAFFSSPISER